MPKACKGELGSLCVLAFIFVARKSTHKIFTCWPFRHPCFTPILSPPSLSTQHILLQASDWDFRFDLGSEPLQFPIEAAATSLSPDIVIYSCTKNIVVMLELTVPLEDRSHLAHERKTSKYASSTYARTHVPTPRRFLSKASAAFISNFLCFLLYVVNIHKEKKTKYASLARTCEENGFTTHFFAIEVGCLGFCPNSFLTCLEALGLPKSSARKIRTECARVAL